MANHTILLIDYEPRSIERFRDPLVAAGYAVELATDGISGIEAFHRLNPDMVLVEAMIPKKHGFEVCQELKRTPHGRRTPIIITTGVYKGRKYRTQALHIYGCDEYIEKPIAPAQLLEIVGGFLAPGVSTPSTQAADPIPLKPEAGDGPIDRDNVDAIAKPGPTMTKDDREDEITARLDALLSGGGSASPVLAASGALAVAAAVNQDPFAQMRAELDDELGSNSTPLAFELAPTLEPLVEPFVSDQLEAPSVLEALAVPQPSVAPVVPSTPTEQPGQLVNFETKRRRKNKKSEQQGAKRSQRIDVAGEVSPAPAPAAAVAVAASDEVVDRVETVLPAAVNSRDLAPQMTLTRGTMFESELEPAASRRGVPVWAWVTVAVVAVVGIYFVAPRGSSSPSGSAPSPAAPTRVAVSAPPVTAPPPVVDAPVAAIPKVSQPSRTVPESPKPAVVAAKVPVPKKRPDPVPAPSVAPPTNTEPSNLELTEPQPATPEPVAVKAPPPSAPDTEIAGVETVPDAAAPAAVSTIAPGALIPIDVADTMPVALKRRAPVYSAAAKQLRLNGTVVMNVLVNDRGTVDQVVLVSGVPGADLNDAAMAAAKTWTYRPATKAGVPVKVWRSEQVVFKP